jgi:hypothetical protein
MDEVADLRRDTRICTELCQVRASVDPETVEDWKNY